MSEGSNQFSKKRNGISQLSHGGLSVRLRNILRANNLNSLEELKALSNREIMALPNLGRGVAEELQNLLGVSMNFVPVDSDSVVSLNLSVRSTNALRGYGVFKVTELLTLSREDLLRIPSLGQRSVSEIMGVRSKIDADSAEDQTKNDEPATSTDTENWGQNYPVDLSLVKPELFCSNIYDLSVLREAGINDAQQALRALDENLFAIHSDEYQVCSKLRHTLVSLFYTSEDFNLGKFLLAKEQQGITIIPSDSRIKMPEKKMDGEFLSEMFNSFLLIAINERSAFIAKSRIWMPDGYQETLEAVASKIGVTRERVRQLEKKALGVLTDFVLNDGYFLKRGKINVVLHPYISKRVDDLREKLASLDQIDLPALVRVLERSFDLSSEDVTEALPFFICMIQGTTQSHLSRSILRGEYQALEDIEKYLGRVKITDLRLSKTSTNNLLSDEIFNVTDIAFLMRLKGIGGGTKAFREAVAVASLCKANENDLKGALVEALKLAQLPSASFENAAESPIVFMEVVGDLVPFITTWNYCPEIYDLRTSRSADQRVTQSECALRIMGSVGSSNSNVVAIARSEQHLLERLATALVDRDYRFARVWIPEPVVDCVKRCRPIFDENNDSFERFSIRLKTQFDTDEISIANFASLMWVLFAGSSPDRYFHLRKKNRFKTAAVKSERFVAGQMIQLRGFRTRH